ncbi:hypothetical protein EIN_174080 [Entamoeba invadens IP1]|uniref:Uncharacterized protein n=1 Tax=Entamoeba invadens IP1 TaxID=370355 RepID=A0A0A1U1F1_ENTIV|nr:hypothetical protein EIN_174080 [Entamoeba invadens IP1]ELP84733.1 hypothetical protein EIN_174080 [Entamoeba invadens IP1]|eukprot:XP_004184079.1 hypothetical protein EIN_174080 [Entamoeba invadens IP1]
MSDSDSISLSLDENDAFYKKKTIAKITAPSDVLHDVINSDDEKDNTNDISNKLITDKTIASREDEYHSRWRKRNVSPVKEIKSYKERINQHFKELEKDKEEKERKRQRDDRDSSYRKDRSDRDHHRSRSSSREHRRHSPHH